MSLHRIISEALDAYCAQVQYQDRHPGQLPLLMDVEELKTGFFPHFQTWIDFLLRRAGSSLPVTKHRIVACVIGASYSSRKGPDSLKQPDGVQILEFIRSSRNVASKFGLDWPESKGRWIGPRGYKAQFDAAEKIVAHLQA